MDYEFIIAGASFAGLGIATPSLGFALEDAASELLSAEVRWES